MNTKESVQNIFRDVFDNPSLVIEDHTNAADIEDWDSLANVDLIVAMENQFHVKFNMKDIQSLKNVGDMIHLIEKSVASQKK